MRNIFFLLYATLCSFNVNAQSLDSHQTVEYDLISDEEIKARLANIQNDVIKPKFDPAVRSYIKTYTVRKRDKVEAMLGRTAIYYPMFEKMLNDAGLPTDLKYLSVVESALNAHATSRSGAVGLWQFMPPTGKEYGLRINREVDERKDPVKATQAAITYLSRLYKKYGNWELALAAYNGGPGRVNRAIKRGRSKNFWRIRRHLPRETRSYVPAYIAATYISHYYQDHGLTPIYPDTEFQLTESVKVYSQMSFDEIQQSTGTPMYIIEYLNPSYKKNFIPSNVKGSNLILPQERMAVFKNTYRSLDGSNRIYTVGERINAPGKRSNAPAGSMQLYYNVEAGDDMASLASAFRCEPTEIMKWNRLTSSQLKVGQGLVVFVSQNAIQPIKILEPIPMVSMPPVVTNQEIEINLKPISLPVETSSKKSKKRKKAKKKKNKKVRYIMHKIQRGETLHAIAAQYQGVTINHLIQLNNIQSAESMKPGTKLKIKEK